MQIDGKWLSFAHFTESARLWTSRHAPEITLSESFLQETEREVLQIATRLCDEEESTRDYSQSQSLFDDCLTANYAHRLGMQALSATLAACREKITHGVACGASDGLKRTQQVASCANACAPSLVCHPALCRLVRKITDVRDAD